MYELFSWFSGFVLIKQHKNHGDKLDSAIKEMLKSANLFLLTFEYIVPILILFFALSTSNPFYTMLRAIHNFEAYGPVIPVVMQVSIGIWATFGFLFMISTLVICILLVAYSISCLYVWTMFLVESKSNVSFKLGGGLGFHSCIKIYKMLRVMTLVEGELIGEFIIPCLHHFSAVAMSTSSVFLILVEVSDRGGKSVLLITSCIVILIYSTMLEIFAICVNAKIGMLSKTFLRRLRMENGRDSYRRRILNGMLPNSVCLECLRSVDMIHNGMQMSYFLSYLDRVTHFTWTLLVAYR